MKKLLMIAALSAALNADTICGKKATTADGHKLSIGCVDFGLMKDWLVIPPGTALQQTQVFVESPREGAAVRVKLGAQSQIGELRRQRDGSLKALVTFEGTEFTELPEVELLVREGR